jgi:hypothetical protein
VINFEATCKERGKEREANREKERKRVRLVRCLPKMVININLPPAHREAIRQKRWKTKFEEKNVDSSFLLACFFSIKTICLNNLKFLNCITLLSFHTKVKYVKYLIQQFFLWKFSEGFYLFHSNKKNLACIAKNFFSVEMTKKSKHKFYYVSFKKSTEMSLELKCWTNIKNLLSIQLRKTKQAKT